MKITGVDLTPVFSRRETGHISRHVIVRLNTDEDPVGLGEMSDVGDWGIMYDLADVQAVFETLLVGKDPLDWRPITVEAAESLRMGGAIQAGLEIALFDLIGKIKSQSIAGLFGGSLKDRLRVCYPIFRNHSAEDAQENVKRVERRIGEGQDLFRLYHGGNVDADEVFLDAVRSQWGDAFRLKSLDFSGRFKWKRVVQVFERLGQYKPIHLESVSDRMDRGGQYEIRKRIDRPISEHVSSVEQAFEFARHGYVDIFNICLCAAGGFTRALHIAQIAHAAGLSCLVGTTQELSIGVSAQAMFGSLLENLDYPADCTGGMLYEHDVVVNRVRYEKGHVIVPEGPGVGMELDGDKLEQLTHPLSTVSDPENVPDPTR